MASLTHETFCPFTSCFHHAYRSHLWTVWLKTAGHRKPPGKGSCGGLVVSCDRIWPQIYHHDLVNNNFVGEKSIFHAISVVSSGIRVDGEFREISHCMLFDFTSFPYITVAYIA